LATSTWLQRSLRRQGFPTPVVMRQGGKAEVVLNDFDEATQISVTLLSTSFLVPAV
jgi:hypothetical protein